MTSSSVIRQVLPGGRETGHSYQQVTSKQQRMKTTINMDSQFGLMAAQALRAVMQGKVALPGEDSYLQARQIYNGAVEYQPALFALCETVADVQAAVRVAREQKLRLLRQKVELQPETSLLLQLPTTSSVSPEQQAGSAWLALPSDVVMAP